MEREGKDVQINLLNRLLWGKDSIERRKKVWDLFNELYENVIGKGVGNNIQSFRYLYVGGLCIGKK